MKKFSSICLQKTLLALLGCLLMAATHAASVKAQHIVVQRDDGGAKVKIGATVRGKGPLIVMVPSLGRGGADFADLATRLANAGYQTVAIDPRGVGQSRGPMDNLTIANLAEDVYAVAKQLSKQPAAYLSHAFGNRMARAIDLHHPESVTALMLMAGGGGQTTPGVDEHKLLEVVFDDALPAEQRFTAVKTAFFAPGNDAAPWRGGWYPALYKTQMAALEATPASYWNGAGLATVSVLMIQSSNDIMAPPQTKEFRAKAYPGRDLEVVTIPNAGHALLPEQPQAMADVVLDFIKRKMPPK